MRRNASTVAAAAALGRAGRATSPYALVAADPLAAVAAAAWRAMWDVARQPGPAEFEQAAVRALTAWRAGAFELPDYYLVLTPDSLASGHGESGVGGLEILVEPAVHP